MIAKHKINLLQSELLPKEDKFTLKNVVLAWGAVFVLMLLLGGYVEYKNQNLQVKHTTVTNINTNLSKQLEGLEIKIKNHKADPQLVEKLATLKMLIANKKMLHQQLINDNDSYVTGFARAMGDLANIHSRDVSLSGIVINQDEITFSGTAKTPEAVPMWLSRFGKSQVLSDKNFNNFSLQENKNNTINFTVSSVKEEVSK